MLEPKPGEGGLDPNDPGLKPGGTQEQTSDKLKPQGDTSTDSGATEQKPQ